MNRTAKIILLLVTVVVCGSLMAAETSVHGRLYSHWEYEMNGADGTNEFGLGRAYVTVKSKLSDQTSVRITTYSRRSTIDDNGKVQSRYYVIIKYGYLDWTPAFGNKALKLRFGLQPTAYIALQNKLWGRRYLVKTVSDMNKFLTSADAGASVHLALGEKGKYGSLSFGLYNGTSYSDLDELNKQKDINLFARVNPLTNSEALKNSVIVAQYYKGTRNVALDSTMNSGDYNNDLLSVGALLAYRNLLRLGADLNWHTEGQGFGMEEAKETGTSLYGTLFLGELADGSGALRTLNLFGRYDIFDPDTKAENDREKLFIVGIECNPTKGFKASVNIRNTSFDDNSPTEKLLFVNTLFKF